MLYENALRSQHGFTDVIRSNSEVAGNKNGCVAIVHLQIAGPNFHEVFMVAGDDAGVARDILTEVVAIIFHPL